MKKKRIRSFVSYVNVAPGVYNQPVYNVIHDGFSNFSLATCLDCGELFVIDKEDPKTYQKTMQQLAGDLDCPTCKHVLAQSIASYPERIWLAKGRYGSAPTDRLIPPDADHIVKEFYEIVAR